MSSQRGNAKKSGPPKHPNKGVFNNTLHDKSKKTKALNSLEINGCCARCKEVIAWKIKYKKYKPLSQSRKCVKCDQRTIKDAYYTVCVPCAVKNGICAKCCTSADIAEPGLNAQEEAIQQSRQQQELKMLTERQRRSFLRMQERGETEATTRATRSTEGDIACEDSGESEASEDETAVASDGRDSPVEDGMCASALRDEALSPNQLELDGDKQLNVAVADETENNMCNPMLLTNECAGFLTSKQAELIGADRSQDKESENAQIKETS